MKKILLTIIGFYFLLTLGGCWIGIPIFKAFMGGGISEEFLYPIYWGIMLLGGLIVICTQLVLEEIRELKQLIPDRKNDSDDQTE